MHDGTFESWFTSLTNHASPRPWQSDLAASVLCRDQMIRIPTGLGKTEGVLAAWSYHRLHRGDDRWPRRLVWCLPMRVLVEQTEQVARELAARIPEPHRPTIHIAMGGEDNSEWFLHPERPAILIGTQDMLLSRALNRGYASPRARWPTEFGLLNQDALWIMDEVQLMDVGLATSAQIQAFRGQDEGKSVRPCHTWWMSATLQPEWLRSVDTANDHAKWVQEPCQVEPDQRHSGLWDITKSLTTEIITKDAHDAFATRILENHNALKTEDFGRITLVVCNTVDRACRTYEALLAAGRNEELELVHGRFRPWEREAWRERFLSRSSCTSGVDRIIVATQVVEAGVDISAGCLVTELAPWSSLVQRFGRCARYGGSGSVLVVDRGRDETTAAPYESEELESAWDALQLLIDQGVGITALESFEQRLTPEARARLYPYSPAHLLLRREFDELFDTTPDLTGADIDISRFIRSGDERDLQVFWDDLGRNEPPPPERRPHRRELCAVPFLKARDWLCGEETKSNRKPQLRGGMSAWVWDWIDGLWVKATRTALLPGRVVCVASSCGGYRIDRGFDPDGNRPVLAIPDPVIAEVVQAIEEADDQQDGEQLSMFRDWKTIATHTAEVIAETRQIAKHLGLAQDLQDALELAATWHDWGKSHPAFQGAIRGVERDAKDDPDRPDRQDLAKAPATAWRRPPFMYRLRDGGESRPAFRHELASALGLFSLLQMYEPRHPALLGPWSQVFVELAQSSVAIKSQLQASSLVQRLLNCSAEAFDLVAYLVASHHGKVRAALHAAPQDQEYRDRDGRGLPIRGVREADHLPAIVLVPGEPAVPEVTLTLALASLGLSERTGISWRERTLNLQEQFGPAGLAFLEAILRAADVRASKLTTPDPLLKSEAHP